MPDAKTLMQRCEILGGVSEEPGVLVRPYGSASMRKVHDRVAGWMRDAGMSVREDGIGNLIARYEGAGDKTLILGSHLDTVRDAGKYDGVLGVLTALACVERLHERGERLPFAVEVVSFADEEGLRFGTAYLGSSVFAGTFDPEVLKLEDADGVSVAEAVRGSGGEPEALAKAGRGGDDLLGYCEVHIEQGPVLEREGLPVGVVEAITGQSRIGVEFSGEAGHAGTVPMEDRTDALCAASEFVLAVESLALAEPGLVATIGEVSVEPGASNVVPGMVRLSLDVRHQDDATRERARDSLGERAAEVAAGRRCEIGWEIRQESSATPTDAAMVSLLSRAVEGAGFPVRSLPSGAGHDAAMMASLTGSAMLFVRCERGISHNPAESVEEEDVAVGIDVMERFLRLAAE